MSTKPLQAEQRASPCDICDAPTPEAGYGSSNCPNCGQLYQYDESVMMVLTTEQYDILREHFKKHPDRKAQYAPDLLQ